MLGDAIRGAKPIPARPVTVDGGGKKPRRRVPLKFWLGPLKLGRVTFLMEVEPWSANWPALSPAALPNLAALSREVDGVYRPSEPISPDDPDLRKESAGIRYIESRFSRRFIDLTTDFDSYLSKFSGRTRSTFRRKLKRLCDESGGNIEWRSYRTASEMETFHAAARQISAVTYQEKLFDAGLPDEPEFVTAMLKRAQAGQVRGFVLFLGGAPVAYLYLPIAGSRVIYGYLGFDPAYAHLSPGTVLQLLALEALFAEGTHGVFDFTEGEGEHKRLFATHACLCGNAYYLRPTLKNRVVVRLHLLVRRLSDLADRLLVRWNLKVRLKHYLRGQRRIWR